MSSRRCVGQSWGRGRKEVAVRFSVSVTCASTRPPQMPLCDWLDNRRYLLVLALGVFGLVQMPSLLNQRFKVIDCTSIVAASRNRQRRKPSLQHRNEKVRVGGVSCLDREEVFGPASRHLYSRGAQHIGH